MSESTPQAGMTVSPPLPEQAPVDGAQTLENAVHTFKKYTVQQSPHEYVALALYVAYTHAAVAFDYAPRLLVTSAEKRSGKSRTLEIIGELCHRPLKTANASTAAIYRSIQPGEPITLIFDEADTLFGTKMKAEQNEDLRGLINAGFQKGMPVIRVENFKDPVSYESFSPAVMAAIGKLPDTITDRAINIRVRRRKPSERVTPYRLRQRFELNAIRDDLSAWITPHIDQLGQMEPPTPLEDRAADLWEPLLAVADLAGGEWPSRARHAALYFTEQAAVNDQESSTGIELLRDVKQVLELVKGPFVASRQLLDYLQGMEDSRWAEEALTARGLASRLKPYSIFPTSNGTVRGYRVATFHDVFDRYLTPPVSEVSEVSETVATSQKVADTSENQSVSENASSVRNVDTTRINPDPAATPDGEEVDASRVHAVSDGLTCQPENKCQPENGDIATNLTGLTHLTHTPVMVGMSCPVHDVELEDGAPCGQCLQ